MEKSAPLQHVTMISQKEPVAVVLNLTLKVTGPRVAIPQQQMLCLWIQATLILVGAPRTVVCALDFAQRAAILPVNQQLQANVSLFKLKIDVEMDISNQVKHSGVVKKCLPGIVSQIPHVVSR